MFSSKTSMLPTPVSLHTRKDSRFRPRRRIRDVLLTRARVTNLALFMLAGFAGLSFLANLSYYLNTEPPKYPLADYISPYSILATIERDRMLRSLDHLVIVPGHAIWKGSTPDHTLAESQWFLETYQKGGGRIYAFYRHITRGIDVAANDDRALLIFSGGQTKKESTTTEAESYMRLAQANNLLPTDYEGYLRATSENYALDSFQNLLFSIARFHEYTGRYPTKITVVGYEMKRKRFTELHRAALRWPEHKFEYIGIDAEGEDSEIAREGENNNGYLPYLVDSYGCHDLLLAKRRSRNPNLRFHSYFTSAPELAALFNWCPGHAEGGPTSIYPGPLPWDHIQ